MKKISQEQQVINVLRKTGGYATLRRLNELVDFSTWATKRLRLPCVVLCRIVLRYLRYSQDYGHWKRCAMRCYENSS